VLSVRKKRSDIPSNSWAGREQTSPVLPARFRAESHRIMSVSTIETPSERASSRVALVSLTLLVGVGLGIWGSWRNRRDAQRSRCHPGTSIVIFYVGSAVLFVSPRSRDRRSRALTGQDGANGSARYVSDPDRRDHRDRAGVPALDASGRPAHDKHRNSFPVVGG
jgi:hypothetical protein